MTLLTKRCCECNEVKDLWDYNNKSYRSDPETWICSECEYNSMEAQIERHERNRTLNPVEDETDPSLLIQDIDQRRAQLSKIKGLIADWESRNGILLGQGGTK